MQHVKKMGHVNSLIQLGLASGERIFNILDTKNDIVNVAQPVHLKTVNQKIIFNNVSFTYESSNKPAIDNINIEIPKGYFIELIIKL